MSKNTTEAPTKKGAKTKAKLNKKELDAKNEAKAVAKATAGKELKYIYPKGCDGPLERKAFRQKVRAKLKSFAKKIENFEGKVKDRKVLEKESAAFSKTVLA